MNSKQDKSKIDKQVEQESKGINKEACKARIFPDLKIRLDLLDWQNVKEQCIRDINAARATIEINYMAMDEATKRIEELSK